MGLGFPSVITYHQNQVKTILSINSKLDGSGDTVTAPNQFPKI
jgi:hypothetical protein